MGSTVSCHDISSVCLASRGSISVDCISRLAQTSVGSQLEVRYLVRAVRQS